MVCSPRTSSLPHLAPLAAVLALSATLAAATVPPNKRRLTLSVDYLSVGYANASTPWMFDQDAVPFLQKRQNTGWYAPLAIQWNPDGRGDPGSCSSDGAGVASVGQVLSAETNIDVLQNPSQFAATLDGLTLDVDSFEHINTVSASRDWKTLGEAGDSRKYSGGVLEVRAKRGNQVMYRASDIELTQTISYMGPVGASPENEFGVSGIFNGRVDKVQSKEDWVLEFDSDNTGNFTALLEGVGVSSNKPLCFVSMTFVLSLRTPGFDGTGDGGGSENSVNETARTLARVGVARSLGTSAMALAAGTAIATSTMATTAAVATVLMSSSASVLAINTGSAGNQKLLRTAAWAAAFGQITGGNDYTAPLQEFSSKLDPFLLRFPAPGTSATATRFLDSSRFDLSNVQHQSSNTTEDSVATPEIDERTFLGVAFYAFLILGGCLVLHGVLAIFVRRQTRSTKIKAHAWMTYLTSIGIAYVFAGTVLGSIQYIGSSARSGGGRVGLYILAALLLLLFGAGIVAFICTVVYFAMQQLGREEIRWVPKAESSDPEVRTSKIIQGEFETDEENVIHGVFACYYDGLRGPRIWVALLDQILMVVEILVIGFVTHHRAAVILVAILGACLAVVVLSMNPFVDKIESVFQCAIAIIQVMVSGLATAAAFAASSTTREMLHYGIVVMEFVSLIFAVLLAIYVDVLTILQGVWAILVVKLCGRASDKESSSDEQSAHLSDLSGVGDDADEEFRKAAQDHPEGSSGISHV